MKGTCLGGLNHPQTGNCTLNISIVSSYYLLKPHCSICLKHKIVERGYSHYLSCRTNSPLPRFMSWQLCSHTMSFTPAFMVCSNTSFRLGNCPILIFFCIPFFTTVIPIPRMRKDKRGVQTFRHIYSAGLDIEYVCHIPLLIIGLIIDTFFGIVLILIILLCPGNTLPLVLF
jgi:hypothetical protein